MSHPSPQNPNASETSSPQNEFIIGAVISLVLASGSFIFGALLGWFWVGYFIEDFAKEFEIPFLADNPRLGAAIILGTLLATSSFFQQRKLFRHRQRREALGKELGFEHSHDVEDDVADSINELLGETSMTDISNVLHREFDSTHVVFADLKIFRSSNSTSDNNSSESKTQTIAFFQDPSLRLPDFEMQPEGFGTRLLEQIVGIKDIDFDSHKEFSKNYLLTSAWENKTRRFFNRELLDFFTQEKGWQIRAHRDRLLIFLPGKMFGEGNDQEFVDNTLAIFGQIRSRSEAFADEPPSPGEDQLVSAEDAIAQVPGLAGRMLRASLVTPSEVKKLVADPPPRREIPAAIKRTKFGVPMMAIVGFGFACGGALFAGIALTSESNAEKGDQWIFAAIGGGFLLIGSIMFIGSVLYRLHWSSLLIRGKVTQGEVLEVKKTTTQVNNQWRYLVKTKYYAEGQHLTREIAIYGTGAKHCEKAASNKQPVHVLYKPGKPESATIAEGLINSRPEYA